MSVMKGIWQGWVNVTVLLLRLVTGRPRPDYGRIAALEIELGYRTQTWPLPFLNIEALVARDRLNAPH